MKAKYQAEEREVKYLVEAVVVAGLLNRTDRYHLNYYQTVGR